MTTLVLYVASILVSLAVRSSADQSDEAIVTFTATEYNFATSTKESLSAPIPFLMDSGFVLRLTGKRSATFLGDDALCSLPFPSPSSTMQGAVGSVSSLFNQPNTDLSEDGDTTTRNDAVPDSYILAATGSDTTSMALRFDAAAENDVVCNATQNKGRFKSTAVFNVTGALDAATSVRLVTPETMNERGSVMRFVNDAFHTPPPLRVCSSDLERINSSVALRAPHGLLGIGTIFSHYGEGFLAASEACRQQEEADASTEARVNTSVASHVSGTQARSETTDSMGDLAVLGPTGLVFIRSTTPSTNDSPEVLTSEALSDSTTESSGDALLLAQYAQWSLLPALISVFQLKVVDATSTSSLTVGKTDKFKTVAWFPLIGVSSYFVVHPPRTSSYVEPGLASSSATQLLEATYSDLDDSVTPTAEAVLFTTSKVEYCHHDLSYVWEGRSAVSSSVAVVLSDTEQCMTLPKELFAAVTAEWTFMECWDMITQSLLTSANLRDPSATVKAVCSAPANLSDASGNRGTGEGVTPVPISPDTLQPSILAAHLFPPMWISVPSVGSGSAQDAGNFIFPVDLVNSSSFAGDDTTAEVIQSRLETVCLQARGSLSDQAPAIILSAWQTRQLPIVMQVHEHKVGIILNKTLTTISRPSSDLPSLCKLPQECLAAEVFVAQTNRCEDRECEVILFKSYDLAARECNFQLGLVVLTVLVTLILAGLEFWVVKRIEQDVAEPLKNTKHLRDPNAQFFSGSGSAVFDSSATGAGPGLTRHQSSSVEF